MVDAAVADLKVGTGDSQHGAGTAQDSVGSQCTHEEALSGSRIVQWSRFTLDPRHSRVLFAWHTVCLVVDSATACVVFVYGWSKSMIAWPFILPAAGYIMVNLGTFSAYLAFGPLRINTSPLWQPVGPVQALQITYLSFLSAFVPITQKPFMRIWPQLFGFMVLAFTGRTIATIAMMDRPDPQNRSFKILRHGVVGGSIAAIRSLDSVTDLQVGFLLVQKGLRSPTVTVFSGPTVSIIPLGDTIPNPLPRHQIVLAVTDWFIGEYLQFNDLKLASETSITRTKLAVHLTSLLCEVGMMGIYITSTIVLRSEEPPPEDGDTTSPDMHDGTGGGASSSTLDGRSTAEAAVFIAFSLCLTLVVFAANLYGMGHIMLGVWRASEKVRASLARVSVTSDLHTPRRSTRSCVGTKLSPTCMERQDREPLDMSDEPIQVKEHEKAGGVTWGSSAKREEARDELELALAPVEGDGESHSRLMV